MSNHPFPMARAALRCRTAGLFCLLPVVVVAAVGCGRSGQDRDSSLVQAASTAFVQTNNATPQSPVSSVSVPFTGAQSAGNLSVVVVGWNDTTARVVSVTDTKGNAYQLAVGPTTVAGALTQSIHYR